MRRTLQTDDETHCSVAIIGGGFTGAVLAAQLLRLSSSLSVTLIEPFIPGRGAAYSTSCSWHLLNVPAGNMSALPDDPEHFLRWAKSNYDSEVQPEDFLPRKVYGQYVEAILRDTIRSCRDRFHLIHDEAKKAETEGGFVKIRLSRGNTITANRTVLALGNFQPSSTHLPGIPKEAGRYLGCAWKIGTVEFEELAQEQSILLIGSGLTAVDIAIGLRAQEYTGTIHILSRHGLLPRGHELEAKEPAAWSGPLPRSIRSLLRLVRTEIACSEKSEWRLVIDSLRPVTAQIWKSLSLAERRRFLRHLRAYWDVHRHRIAPAVNAQIQQGISDGGIQLHAGRIVEYGEEADAAVVTYRDRKSGEVTQLQASRVINCTTPETDCRKVASPLVRGLLADGLVRADTLCLGFDAADDGALIAADGKKSDLLYTLGPALKGQLWESIAVPEIRVQIANLAANLIGQQYPETRSVDDSWEGVSSGRDLAARNFE